MSPERISNEQYSFPADIWSLGLALIECATGQYPYDASVGPLQLMIQVGVGVCRGMYAAVQCILAGTAMVSKSIWLRCMKGGVVGDEGRWGSAAVLSIMTQPQGP